MYKINFKQILTSRKFWVAVLGVSVVAYIIKEGFIDASAMDKIGEEQ